MICLLNMVLQLASEMITLPPWCAKFKNHAMSKTLRTSERARLGTISEGIGMDSLFFGCLKLRDKPPNCHVPSGNLWQFANYILKMAIEIVGLPIENGDVP